MKIKKKRAVAISCLAVATAVGGFAAGVAVASDKTVQAPKEYEFVQTVSTSKQSLGEFIITAYCPCEKCCGKYADGLTATGTIATEGRTCAVDPEVIPLGTEIEIDGVKYVAEDTGGAIKGKKIDICFNDHRSAVEYGVKLREVYTR